MLLEGYVEAGANAESEVEPTAGGSGAESAVSEEKQPGVEAAEKAEDVGHYEAQVKMSYEGQLRENKLTVREMKAELYDLESEIGFERATVWISDVRRGKLWASASTEMGNTTFWIGEKVGLAGSSASSGRIVIANDVAKDNRFYRQVDGQTAFHTRQVICAPFGLVPSDKNTEQKDRVVVQPTGGPVIPRLPVDSLYGMVASPTAAEEMR